MQRTGVFSGTDATLIPNTLAILTWLHEDEIIAKLKTMAAERDFAGAIPLADRPALLKKVEKEILQAQRYAEACYRFAEAAGYEVIRRADFQQRPIVLLGFTAIKEPKTVEADEVADAADDMADAEFG
jgi:hypothetical protein